MRGKPCLAAAAAGISRSSAVAVARREIEGGWLPKPQSFPNGTADRGEEIDPALDEVLRWARFVRREYKRSRVAAKRRLVIWRAP